LSSCIKKKNAEEFIPLLPSPRHSLHTALDLGSSQADFFPGEELYFVYFFFQYRA